MAGGSGGLGERIHHAATLGEYKAKVNPSRDYPLDAGSGGKYGETVRWWKFFFAWMRTAAVHPWRVADSVFGILGLVAYPLRESFLADHLEEWVFLAAIICGGFVLIYRLLMAPFWMYQKLESENVSLLERLGRPHFILSPKHPVTTRKDSATGRIRVDAHVQFKNDGDAPASNVKVVMVAADAKNRIPFLHKKAAPANDIDPKMSIGDWFRLAHPYSECKNDDDRVHVNSPGILVYAAVVCAERGLREWWLKIGVNNEEFSLMNTIEKEPFEPRLRQFLKDQGLDEFLEV